MLHPGAPCDLAVQLDLDTGELLVIVDPSADPAVLWAAATALLPAAERGQLQQALATGGPLALPIQRRRRRHRRVGIAGLVAALLLSAPMLVPKARAAGWLVPPVVACQNVMLGVDAAAARSAPAWGRSLAADQAQVVAQRAAADRARHHPHKRPVACAGELCTTTTAPTARSGRTTRRRQPRARPPDPGARVMPKPPAPPARRRRRAAAGGTVTAITTPITPAPHAGLVERPPGSGHLWPPEFPEAEAWKRDQLHRDGQR